MTTPLLPRITRFAGFKLDRDTGRLTRAGRPVPLADQGFRVLARLTECPGQPVTREELQEMLWPGDTSGDFDNKLNGIVRKIRIALDDSSTEPRYVETLPRRGYRFKGTVEPADGSHHRRRRRRALGIGVTAVAATLAVAALSALFPRVGHTDVPRLAVLGFESGASGDTSALVRNMSVEVAHALARLDPSAINVFAPETGRRIGNGQPHVQPDYVVTGTVDRTLDSIHVLTQLVRAGTGRVVWSEVFVTSAAGILSTPHRIADQIAGRLRVGIVPHGTIEDVAPDALDDYWRARLLWSTGDIDAVQQSIRLFRRAADAAPSFAAAKAGLADAFNTLALMGGMLPREGFDSAAVYARRAIAREERLASAHAALGLALYLGAWDWDAAVAALHRAIELQPGRAEPHAYLASIHSVHGRHDRAIAESRRATDRDPLAPMTNTDLAWYYYYAGRYEETLTQVAEVRARHPDAQGLDLGLALALHAAGRHDEAVSAIGAFMLEQNQLEAAEELEAVRLRKDGRSAWQWWLQQAAGTAQPGRIDYLATAAAALTGDHATALASIRRAADVRVSWAPFVSVDPAFASLIDHTEFARLQREMGLSSVADNVRAGAGPSPPSSADPEKSDLALRPRPRNDPGQRR